VIKKLFIFIAGMVFGFIFGCFGVKHVGNFLPSNNPVMKILSPIGAYKRQTIGFLPYWLIAQADKDYVKYLTTLAYFGLTVDADGSLEKFTNPGEAEPGFYALDRGKPNNFFKDVKENNVNLSLVIFNSNEEKIGRLIADPVTNAQNLIEEVEPFMKKYEFDDLNLDIESVSIASDEARTNFTLFVAQVKKSMNEKNLGTLTVDVSPTALIKNYLINLDEVGKIVDYIVLMTYDYHYFGSSVTGPVAPVGGAGVEAEFDTEVAIKVAINTLPLEKVIMGVPLYGYEWETLEDSPRSATIPGTGLAASNRRVEKYLADCTDCEVKIDKYGQESYFIYKDEKTATYHQIFYPDKAAIKAKVKLAERFDIGGIALWALGYEGATILDPLLSFR